MVSIRNPVAHGAAPDGLTIAALGLMDNLGLRDLKSLQARALEEGIPYQTFAATVLHKCVNGHLVNQR